ncbi:DUF4229 domain-containing protein [Georgenia sunbinii]|uniref:DUF4229 domain-containing protein n=1 Tax=Georgenia sunbinii TaxID=3117728 RepID=UPI002F25F4AE
MPVLIYTLLRIAMFVAVYLVLGFVGFRGWLLIVVAVVVAALLSFLLLPRHANAAAGVIADRVGDRPSRIDQSIEVDQDVEDAILDGEPRRPDEPDQPRSA